MEGGYISRQKAEEWLMDLLTPKCTEQPNAFYLQARDHAIETIKSVPTADVAEVVRCRLCKNSAYHSAKKCWCREHRKFVPLVGFCSYGKKMDGKGEGE